MGECEGGKIRGARKVMTMQSCAGGGGGGAVSCAILLWQRGKSTNEETWKT